MSVLVTGSPITDPGVATPGQRMIRGNPDAPLVGGALVGAERCVRRGPGEPAIVGGKDHERLVGKPLLGERREDPPEAVVHAFDHGCVGRRALPIRLGHRLVAAHHLGLGLQRRVDSVMGEMKEERLPVRPADKPHSLVGEPVGEVLTRYAILEHVPCGPQAS